MRHLLPLLFLLPLAPARSAQFVITYNGVPPDAQTAIAAAADVWSGILVSPVPIKVLATWAPMGSLALATTFPNGRRDFPGAPLPDTWYATSLANSITGIELDPGENDIEIFINSSTTWYFGTDGMPGPGQYDLMSIALHELCHGLGFVGLSKKEGSDGSLGLLTSADFAPLFTTFPWPQLDTLPSVFDRFLTEDLNGPLAQMPDPGPELGAALTSNAVRFSGPIAVAGNSGMAPRIYAPSAFALGSSCVHLNESTYPTGDPNELMTPFSSSGHADHWPGPICLDILRDIGWTLAAGVGIAEAAEDHEAPLFPVPTSRLVHWNGPDSPVDAVVLDPTGRPVLHTTAMHVLDVSTLPDGCYLLVTQDGRTRTRRRFIKATAAP